MTVVVADERRQHSRRRRPQRRRARAQHPNGVGRIDIRVQGEANWPTKFDTTFSQVYHRRVRATSRSSAVARIPINAPLRGRITVTATAVDVEPPAGLVVAGRRVRSQRRAPRSRA